MGLALAVHGGAWNVPDAEVRAHREGVAIALRTGWEMLCGGAAALDVVEAVVRVLEDDPTFNAGRGSHLNRLGRVEMDASIMQGTRLEAGAVAAVQRVRNPVSLARRVMEASPHVLLVGEGAQRFAQEQGVPLCRARDLLVGKARERYLRIRSGAVDLVDQEFSTDEDDRYLGTVGAAALDALGHTAAATSTGGTLNKYPGRVGDSPLIGAGTYADDLAGAASCTGWGEGIIRVVLAKTAIDRLAAGVQIDAAGQAALADLARVDARAGILLVDRYGRARSYFNTPRMARGLATAEQGLRVGVDPAMEPLA